MNMNQALLTFVRKTDSNVFPNPMASASHQSGTTWDIFSLWRDDTTKQELEAVQNYAQT